MPRVSQPLKDVPSAGTSLEAIELLRRRTRDQAAIVGLVVVFREAHHALGVDGTEHLQDVASGTMIVVVCHAMQQNIVTFC